MALFGLSLVASRPYQSPRDPDFGKPEATTFMLCTLDSRVMGRIRDAATTVTVDPQNPANLYTHVNIHEMRFQTVMFGCQGWSNLMDPATGKPIPYRTQPVTVGQSTYQTVDPDVLRMVDPDTLEELATAIRDGNTLTPAQAGNSDAS